MTLSLLFVATAEISLLCQEPLALANLVKALAHSPSYPPISSSLAPPGHLAQLEVVALKDIQGFQYEQVLYLRREEAKLCPVQL